MPKSISLLEINTDGGSRGNPGPAAIGAIAKAQSETVFTISERIGDNTNNVAEYTAVLRSLEKIKSEGIHTEKILFILDSELVVKQITGKYKVKQPHLIDLRQKIVSQIAELRTNGQIKLLSFINVPREKNKVADSLVNLALDN